DALVSADQDADIDFSKYQSIIIFHSGVGADFVLDPLYDPTPNDVSSVFLDFNHLTRTLGKGQENFKGIAVDNNSIFIREGLILPETESKQGYEIGLNGIIAHQFGHQLGLPSLFNTDDGRPAIGKWGLMDVGFGNINGLVPAQPCAWSKVFLGWEDPIEIREGTKIPVYAALSKDTRHIYKIPISKEEYFLIENRQQDYAKDSLKSVISPRGVLLEVDDYDFDIPGSGLLIWHIDERVIAQGLINNTVNADPQHRGIDLEEADGAQDIGEVFEGALPGFALPVNGIPEDAYYSGNNDTFTSSTNPNSNSYYRANSHISITGVSAIDTVMTFAVSIGFQRAGFPQFMGGICSGLSPAVGSLDDKQQGIVAATSSGDVIVIKGSDGKPFLGTPENRKNINRIEDTTLVPVTIFAKVTPPVRTSPVLWRLPTERYSAAALIDAKNTLYIWKLADENGDGWGDVLVEKPLSRQITSELVVQTISSNNIGLCFGDVEGHVTVLNNDGTLFWESPSVGDPVTGLALVETGGLYTDGITAITKRGKLTSFSISGNVNWTKELNFTGAYPPAVAAMVDPLTLNIICIDSTGNLAVLDEKGNFLQGFPKQEPAKFMSPPAVGDVDGDGYLDIIILGDREVYGYNYTGASLDNFPLTLIRSDSGTVGRAQPLLADLNTDGKMEIITGSIGGTVTALNSNGDLVQDFPFACGEILSGTPAIADIDDDKNLNLIIGNDDTWLYDWALNVPAATGKIAWGGYLGNAQHTGQALQKASPEGIATDRLFENGSVYNYPNPVEGFNDIHSL
ncbi:MAG: FG-GAP-like repeat-containing protein, partial [Patescibacteria group bacterium]|nr:FG-GAP-like repeat-containing protein [Patescibacteria group bacterium]